MKEALDRSMLFRLAAGRMIGTTTDCFSTEGCSDE